MQTALNDHQELFDRYDKTSLAINLSAKELSEFTFRNTLRESISNSPLMAKRLMFELTETELYSSRSSVSRNLLLLRGLGARLSIDDYGTGLSNAARLTTAPFDEVKLDQSFTKRALSSGENAIVRSTAQIAKSYNMHTVAEGVETQEILDCVKELNIDQVQGYLLHKPQSFEELMNSKMLQLT